MLGTGVEIAFCAWITVSFTKLRVKPPSSTRTSGSNRSLKRFTNAIVMSFGNGRPNTGFLCSSKQRCPFNVIYPSNGISDTGRRSSSTACLPVQRYVLIPFSRNAARLSHVLFGIELVVCESRVPSTSKNAALIMRESTAFTSSTLDQWQHGLSGPISGPRRTW